MNIFKKLFRWLFWRKKKISKPIVKEPSYKLIQNVEWITCPKGPSSWNHAAGLPVAIADDFIRLRCEAVNEVDYFTAAIKTDIAYYDGKFECEARFNSGHGTWPAIWCSHPNGAKDNYSTYYEVDLSEYYETRDNTETTYHCPESMRDSNKYYYKNVKTKITPTEWTKFAMTWDEEAIKVYINDVCVMNIENDGNPDYFPVNEKDRTFQFILSMQYNNKHLSKIDLTELPLWMDVRNINIYEKV